MLGAGYTDDFYLLEYSVGVPVFILAVGER